jgi:hypothetical protein
MKIKTIITIIFLAVAVPAGRAAEISGIYSDVWFEIGRDEASYRGFLLIEVVAVAKTCRQKYGDKLAKNLKGVRAICDEAFKRAGGLEYHVHAQTLPGEELNCFYLDVLEQMASGGRDAWVPWSVYCQEERRILREYYGSPE